MGKAGSAVSVDNASPGEMDMAVSGEPECGGNVSELERDMLLAFKDQEDE